MTVPSLKNHHVYNIPSNNSLLQQETKALYIPEEKVNNYYTFETHSIPVEGNGKPALYSFPWNSFLFYFLGGQPKHICNNSSLKFKAWVTKMNGYRHFVLLCSQRYVTGVSVQLLNVVFGHHHSTEYIYLCRPQLKECWRR